MGDESTPDELILTLETSEQTPPRDHRGDAASVPSLRQQGEGAESVPGPLPRPASVRDASALDLEASSLAMPEPRLLNQDLVGGVGSDGVGDDADQASDDGDHPKAVIEFGAGRTRFVLPATSPIVGVPIVRCFTPLMMSGSRRLLVRRSSYAADSPLGCEAPHPATHTVARDRCVVRRTSNVTPAAERRTANLLIHSIPETRRMRTHGIQLPSIS